MKKDVENKINQLRIKHESEMKEFRAVCQKLGIMVNKRNNLIYYDKSQFNQKNLSSKDLIKTRSQHDQVITEIKSSAPLIHKKPNLIISDNKSNFSSGRGSYYPSESNSSNFQLPHGNLVQQGSPLNFRDQKQRHTAHLKKIEESLRPHQI